MSYSIFLLKQSLSNINYNINVYEKMDSCFITDEDRKVTLNDLYEAKSKLEKDIEILTKNND